jgi:orotate phosphoribosyltransferase-like protein
MSQISNLIVEIMELQNGGLSVVEIAAILNYPVDMIETALQYEEEDV